MLDYVGMMRLRQHLLTLNTFLVQRKNVEIQIQKFLAVKAVRVMAGMEVPPLKP
jgi:hypothetical protein